jgi:phosphohistidine phosphatase
MTQGSGRKLVLFRHAKSAWPAGVADHERPLAPRGQRDAPVMGRWLRDAGYTPGQVLCSTARRARETWQFAQTGLGTTPPVTFEPGVYEATAAGLLAIIRRTPAAVGTLLVIGHNPTMEELALMLAAAVPGTRADPLPNTPAPNVLERMQVKFPTAAIAVLEFGVAWRALAQGRAHLAAFVTPRDPVPRHRAGPDGP